MLPRSPCARIPPPLPRWNPRVPSSLASPTIAAFPVLWPGRLPHQPFRGLHGVRFTLRSACSPSHLRDPLHRRLRPLRFLHDRSDCYRLERKLPSNTAASWLLSPYRKSSAALPSLSHRWGGVRCDRRFGRRAPWWERSGCGTRPSIGLGQAGVNGGVALDRDPGFEHRYSQDGRQNRDDCARKESGARRARVGVLRRFQQRGPTFERRCRGSRSTDPA